MAERAAPCDADSPLLSSKPPRARRPFDDTLAHHRPGNLGVAALLAAAVSGLEGEFGRGGRTCSVVGAGVEQLEVHRVGYQELAAPGEAPAGEDRHQAGVLVGRLPLRV